MSEGITSGIIMLASIVIGYLLSELTKEIHFRWQMKKWDKDFQKYLESLGK